MKKRSKPVRTELLVGQQITPDKVMVSPTESFSEAMRAVVTERRQNEAVDESYVVAGARITAEHDAARFQRMFKDLLQGAPNNIGADSAFELAVQKLTVQETIDPEEQLRVMAQALAVALDYIRFLINGLEGASRTVRSIKAKAQ
jgi:hypothetical protein